jgi:hypothetical protein
MDADPEDSAGGGDRRVTAVVYLTGDGPADDAPADDGRGRSRGGALRLWAPAGGGCVDVAPLPGRMAIFLSGAIPHQVQRVRRERLAFTSWFY